MLVRFGFARYLMMYFGCFHCLCLACGACGTVAIRYAPNHQWVDGDRVH